MRRLLFLLLLCGSAAAQEEPPAAGGRVRLEVEAVGRDLYVGEAVPVRLRVLLDRGFFESSSVPLFGRRLDLQVEVRAPWLDDLPGVILSPGADPEEGAERLSFALNDEVVRGVKVPDRIRDGRTYSVLEVERTLLPTRPGEVVLSAPTLRFAYATRFEEDFLSGRRPLDRREALVEGETVRFTVRALPEEGCPPGFSGAVGRFTVRADAAPPALAVGESFALTLRVEGKGDLSRFRAPALDASSGLHVYGIRDHSDRESRTFVYELAPTRVVTEVPAIPFVFFDPGPPAAYRTVRTDPIPLEVRGAAGDVTAPPAEPATEASGPSLPLVLGLAAAALLGLGLAVRRVRRGREPVDPAGERARGAGAIFREAVRDPGADLAGALADYLGARLGCSPAAVIAPDLPRRLRAAGWETDLADRTATLLERLVAARYGDEGVEDDAAAATTGLVEELEAVFARESSGY